MKKSTRQGAETNNQDEGSGEEAAREGTGVSVKALIYTVGKTGCVEHETGVIQEIEGTVGCMGAGQGTEGTVGHIKVGQGTEGTVATNVETMAGSKAAEGGFGSQHAEHRGHRCWDLHPSRRSRYRSSELQHM
ncbi:unnamed protein product [Staurois parvus]|uniref:Uncharacterized protein n=1 Tax=Staurois parvus TaxID=386267 RepID=A0ABN9DRJ5_9NEOB|nr:unnamed protein product [Staurois parvus]